MDNFLHASAKRQCLRMNDDGTQIEVEYSLEDAQRFAISQLSFWKHVDSRKPTGFDDVMSKVLDVNDTDKQATFQRSNAADEIRNSIREFSQLLSMTAATNAREMMTMQTYDGHYNDRERILPARQLIDLNRDQFKDAHSTLAKGRIDALQAIKQRSQFAAVVLELRKNWRIINPKRISTIYSGQRARSAVSVDCSYASAGDRDGSSINPVLTIDDTGPKFVNDHAKTFASLEVAVINMSDNKVIGLASAWELSALIGSSNKVNPFTTSDDAKIPQMKHYLHRCQHDNFCRKLFAALSSDACLENHRWSVESVPTFDSSQSEIESIMRRERILNSVDIVSLDRKSLKIKLTESLYVRFSLVEIVVDNALDAKVEDAKSAKDMENAVDITGLISSSSVKSVASFDEIAAYLVSKSQASGWAAVAVQACIARAQALLLQHFYDTASPYTDNTVGASTQFLSRVDGPLRAPYKDIGDSKSLPGSCGRGIAVTGGLALRKAQNASASARVQSSSGVLTGSMELLREHLHRHRLTELFEFVAEAISVAAFPVAMPLRDFFRVKSSVSCAGDTHVHLLDMLLDLCQPNSSAKEDTETADDATEMPVIGKTAGLAGKPPLAPTTDASGSLESPISSSCVASGAATPGSAQQDQSLLLLPSTLSYTVRVRVLLPGSLELLLERNSGSGAARIFTLLSSTQLEPVMNHQSALELLRNSGQQRLFPDMFHPAKFSADLPSDLNKSVVDIVVGAFAREALKVLESNHTAFLQQISAANFRILGNRFSVKPATVTQEGSQTVEASNHTATKRVFTEAATVPTVAFVRTFLAELLDDCSFSEVSASLPRPSGDSASRSNACGRIIFGLEFSFRTERQKDLFQQAFSAAVQLHKDQAVLQVQNRAGPQDFCVILLEPSNRGESERDTGGIMSGTSAQISRSAHKCIVGLLRKDVCGMMSVAFAHVVAIASAIDALTAGFDI